MATVILASLLVSPSTFASEFKGGYAGAFFQVPVGARPTGMGGAYLAVSDDGAAPLFNPAGLANLKKPLFASSYRVMQLDRKLGYITTVAPIQGHAALGVSWLYAGSGSVDARDTDGDLLGWSISNNNHQFSVVFAKRFERLLAVGTNISFLYATMPEINATAVGFDFGAMFYLDQLFDRNARETMKIQDMQIGLTVRHIAKTYRWTSDQYDKIRRTGNQLGALQEDKVPIEIGLGGSARFLKRKLLLAADFKGNDQSQTEFHAGGEYYLNTQLALRTGFSDGRFTAGTGYLFRVSGRQLLIDYAFSTDKANEGSEHIFSFDLLF